MTTSFMSGISRCSSYLIRAPQRHTLHKQPFFSRKRLYQVPANEVKIGQLIDVNKKIFVVLKNHHHCAGRGAGSYKLDLKDVRTGHKAYERLNTNQFVEGVDLEVKKFEFMYLDNGTIHAIDPETFDELEFNANLLSGDKIALFLQPQTPITIHYHAETKEPVLLTAPEKATFIIAECPPPTSFVTNEGKGTNFKAAKLDNGENVIVPEFLKLGDPVVVELMTGKYVCRG